MAIAWLVRPDENAICYVLPVLWMTSCFHIVESMGQNQRRHYASSSSPSGSTRGKVEGMPEALHAMGPGIAQLQTGFYVLRTTQEV